MFILEINSLLDASCVLMTYSKTGRPEKEWTSYNNPQDPIANTQDSELKGGCCQWRPSDHIRGAHLA